MADDLTVEIIHRISTIEGVDGPELESPLYDSIDPDALEKLVSGTERRGDGAELNVSFTYLGYRVTVTGDGEVSVRQADDERPVGESR